MMMHPDLATLLARDTDTRRPGQSRPRFLSRRGAASQGIKER